MPHMIVVAGPPGGGKSTLLGREHFAAERISYFNIDDRCNELHGSAQQIPLHIRNRANLELRRFCMDHFQAGQTFAFETTLRAPFAIEQTGLAKAAGFNTELHFMAAPVEVHIDRVKARAQGGGHAASERTLRDMYTASLANLPSAIRVFDHSHLYDCATDVPMLLVEISDNSISRFNGPLPRWMESGLLSARQLDRSSEP